MQCWGTDCLCGEHFVKEHVCEERTSTESICLVFNYAHIKLKYFRIFAVYAFLCIKCALG